MCSTWDLEAQQTEKHGKIGDIVSNQRGEGYVICT